MRGWLFEQALEGLLHAEDPAQLPVHPGENLGRITIALEDHERRHPAAEVLLERALGPEDRALLGAGTGHGLVVVGEDVFLPGDVPGLAPHTLRPELLQEV